jgi:hypothetical protein
MVLKLLSPRERAMRALRRLVWRARKVLNPSLASVPRLYADKQYTIAARIDATRKRWVGLRSLTGGRYLLRFPARLTNTERLAFNTLQEAEVVIPRVCRQVVSDALRPDETGRPVLVGPWTTEIGFELLYWIPFLRHFSKRYGGSPDRLIAISRGGVASWYDGICGRYVDLFDLMDVDTFVRKTRGREQEQGGKKGSVLTHDDFERDIYRQVAGRLGLTDYAVLSPSVMYVMFRNIWRGRYSADRLLKTIDIQPMSPTCERPALPFGDPYTVVKFYESSNFAVGPDTSAFLGHLIRDLATRGPVVLLNTGARIDDHSDVDLSQLPNVFDASKLYSPRNNLEMQTAIVAHAQALHCTYGGFAYLGPLLGVPTVCYFTKPNFVGTHLDLAIRQLHPEAGLLSVSPVAVASRELMHRLGRPALEIKEARRA